MTLLRAQLETNGEELDQWEGSLSILLEEVVEFVLPLSEYWL